jgi:hypothetical protein
MQTDISLHVLGSRSLRLLQNIDYYYYYYYYFTITIIIDIIVIIIIIWNCHICVRLFLYFILTHAHFVTGLELLC